MVPCLRDWTEIITKIDVIFLIPNTLAHFSIAYSYIRRQKFGCHGLVLQWRVIQISTYTKYVNDTLPCHIHVYFVFLLSCNDYGLSLTYGRELEMFRSLVLDGRSIHWTSIQLVFLKGMMWRYLFVLLCLRCPY